jgi:putative membrane protein
MHPEKDREVGYTKHQNENLAILPARKGATKTLMNLFDILTYSKLILLPSAQRGEYHPWWGPGMMGSWGSGWMGWFGSVMYLLFWGLVVFVLFLLARRLWSSSQSSSEVMRNESPMDILKRRYASGEIDREEFEQKKQDLSSISP